VRNEQERDAISFASPRAEQPGAGATGYHEQHHNAQEGARHDHGCEQVDNQTNGRVMANPEPGWPEGLEKAG
jgi:hypothetical protein